MKEFLPQLSPVAAWCTHPPCAAPELQPLPSHPPCLCQSQSPCQGLAASSCPLPCQLLCLSGAGDPLNPPLHMEQKVLLEVESCCCQSPFCRDCSLRGFQEVPFPWHPKGMKGPSQAGLGKHLPKLYMGLTSYFSQAYKNITL